MPLNHAPSGPNPDSDNTLSASPNGIAPQNTGGPWASFVPRAEAWAAAPRAWKQPFSTPKVSSAQQTRVLEAEEALKAPYIAALLPVRAQDGGDSSGSFWNFGLRQSHTTPTPAPPTHTCSQTPLNAIKQGQELPAGLERAENHSLSPCPGFH